MKLGLITDIHEHVEFLARALARFERERVEQIVVIGDINTHDGNRWPTANAAKNIPDSGYWTDVVQKFEKGQAGTYLDGGGNARTIANPGTINSNTPRSNAIIGYSYWAHTHDIRGAAWTDKPALQRPGLRIKTFFFDVNEYGAQNDQTIRRTSNRPRIVRVALNQRGDPYRSGATGPNAFDCSGLVRFAYERAHVGRRLGGGHSARAMYLWGRSHGLTSRRHPRIGDVVVYGRGSHVGIGSPSRRGARIHRIQA